MAGHLEERGAWHAWRHEGNLHVADVALLGWHIPKTHREKGIARQHICWSQGLKVECVREKVGAKWRDTKAGIRWGEGR